MCARLPLSLFATLLFSALTFLFPYIAKAGTAPKHDVLRLIQRCPAFERLCLNAGLRWTPDRKGRVTYQQHGYPIVDSITQDVVISGRLNGGASRVFVLRTDGPSDDFHNPENDLGAVAFFGRSPNNRPVILTDHGRIEILTKSVDVSYGEDLVMVDDRTWKIAANFLSGQSLTITSEREIGIWNERTKTCIVAPTENMRGLQIRDIACRRRSNGKSYVLDQIAGDVAPAQIPIAPMRSLFEEVWGLEGGETPDTDETKTFYSFGGGGNGFHVYRIGTSHMLLVAITHDPC